MVRRLIYTITIFYSVLSVQGQEILQDKIFIKNIKTVLMYLEDDDMSLAVWDLNSTKNLTLIFDELTTESKDYYYTIIHCNSDWTQSRLDQSEYIDGYFEDQISNYESSFNTNVNYVHYKLHFPNEYMRPTVSGNYIIKVYDRYNPEKIIFTKRFLVAERKTDIKVIFKMIRRWKFL